MHQLRGLIRGKHLSNLSDCKGMSYDHVRHRAITKLITLYFCLAVCISNVYCRSKYISSKLYKNVLKSFW